MGGVSGQSFVFRRASRREGKDDESLQSKKRRGAHDAVDVRDPPPSTATRDRDQRDARPGVSTFLDMALRIVPIGCRSRQPRLLQRDDIRVVVLDVTQERFLVELFAHPAEKRVAVPRHEALRLARRGIERGRGRAGIALGPTVAPRALAGVGRPTDGREEPLHRDVPRVVRANHKRVQNRHTVYHRYLVSSTVWQAGSAAHLCSRAALTEGVFLLFYCLHKMARVVDATLALALLALLAPLATADARSGAMAADLGAVRSPPRFLPLAREVSNVTHASPRV